ncbi:hypothetical protein B5F07_04090 [Lachnoclostridium sp. An169]|uniref:LysR family transcriptional regulator n=1 Tax=Lachnoclostridium sp. An169 TaxID=1965569 RepID=UPI000B3A127F|nr:LysR family transcriptional regulator [Lachnoclostridium sp. An169]OUP85850.1 hypothetical protein B5F07_04090 [Lachnoclostridium sp. An169]
MFELYQLEQLVTIAKCGTLSEAARELYISQPALSRSMQKLEKDLGFPLFEHRKNRVIMTPTGVLAVSYARDLLKRAREMQDQLTLYNRTRNTISIGSCAPAPLWEMIPAYSSRYPDMAISTEIHAEEELLIRNLEEGIHRLIVTTGPVEKEGIISVPYFEEILYLAVPKDHPLARHKELYLRDLKNLTIILHSRIGFWYDLCRREMVNPNFILQDDLDQFVELSASSSLPSFTTNVSSRRFHRDYDRAFIHILDEEANVMYYCSCLEAEAEYLPKALQTAEETAGED